MKSRHSIRRILPFPAVILAALTLVTGGHAATVTKAATGTDLTDGASWGGSAPGSGDVAAWASTSYGTGLTLEASSSWGGISVEGALSAIDVTGEGPLTLGSDGINMSAATVDLTLGLPIALDASQTWTVNSGRTLTASGIISGSSMGLTKAGLGTLTLSGANTFGGSLTLSGGTLTLNRQAGSLSPTALTFGDTATFNLDNTDATGALTQTLGALAFSVRDGTVKTTRTADFDQAITFASLAARAAGATGNFVNTGTNSATNGFIFTTAPTASRILDRGFFYNGSSYAAYDSNGFVRGLIYGTDTNANASLSGTTVTTLGTIDATKDAQFVGAAAATTTLAVAFAVNATSITVADGTKFKAGQAITGTGILANTFVTAIADNVLTLSAVTNAANSNLTTVMTPYNNVSAQTTGAVNTLNLSGPGSSLTLTAGQMLGIDGILRSGGSAGVVGAISGGSGIMTNTSSGELVIRTNLAIDTLEIRSPILDNGASSVTKTGSGTLSLSGSNTYFGGTIINAGTLTQAVTLNANWAGTGPITVQRAGTLVLNRNNIASTVTLTLNGGTLNVSNSFPSTVSGPVVLGTTSTFNIAGGGSVSLDNTVSGPGGLTKIGTSTLPLNGASNTYTGPTTVSTGRLTIKSSLYDNDSAQWTPANITVASGAALILNVGGAGEFTMAQAGTMFAQIGGVVNNNGLKAGSQIGVSTSSLGAAGVQTISANITDSTGPGGGAVGFRHVGVGTLELTGANTYSGLSITDNNGTLKVSSLNSVNGGTPLLASSSLGAPSTIANGTIGLGTNATFQGGNLTYTGTGETTDRVINLGGANGTTYRFDQSGTGLLKFTSAFTITDNRGAKTIVLQGSTAGSGEIAGVIPLGQSTAAPNHLTKSGTGTWTLSAANANAGGVFTVNGGCLVLNHATALPGGIGVSGGMSALKFNGGVIGLGAGDFTRSLAAATTVTGVNFTGDGGWAAYGADRAVNLGGASATIIWAMSSIGLNGRTLILGNATATHTVDFQNPLDLSYATRTVQVDNGGAAIDGKLSGSLTNGGLIKTGEGTLALTGSNDYGGDTTVLNGTLLVNGTNSGTGLVFVDSGATLGGTGTIGGSVTVATDGNLAPGASAGTLSIGGDLDISAPANGSTGKLKFDLATPTTSDKIAVTGTLTIGTGMLGLTDFVLTNLGGLQAGTYTLITSTGGIIGTLDPNDRSGTIGSLFISLRINDNNLELFCDGDSDSDGFPDSYELAHTTPPSATALNPNDDLENGGAGDGLTNLQEYQRGTDPNKADTDGDGVNDGTEINHPASYFAPVLGTFTYPQAVTDATAKHGRVASFPNAADYTRMAGKARQTTQGYLWIGLSDAVTEGTWLWTDGTTATYSRWLAGEPSGGVEQNHVVIMENSQQWADGDQNYVAAGYIFERVGLDPLVADTDGDGLTDGQELNTTHSSPVLDDTDGDGLTDGAEVNTHGSSPLLTDTDADGLNDRVEVEVYHTNPALKDSDHDGFDDLFEVNTGFDPALVTSTPDALSTIRTAVEFRFNAATGVSYRIEASLDLTQWDTIEPAIIGESAVVTRFYSIENQPKRYFRVRRN